jgi:hypothetical protein
MRVPYEPPEPSRGVQRLWIICAVLAMLILGAALLAFLVNNAS